MENTVTIRYRNHCMTVPRHIIDRYHSYLLQSPHYNDATAETHISFLYSGNMIPVTEFIQWYESHPEFPALKIKTV